MTAGYFGFYFEISGLGGELPLHLATPEP